MDLAPTILAALGVGATGCGGHPVAEMARDRGVRLTRGQREREGR